MLQDLYQFICYVYIEKYGPIYKRRAMLLASTSTKMFVSSRIRLSLRGSYARLRDTMHNPETLYVNSVRPSDSVKTAECIVKPFHRITVRHYYRTPALNGRP